MPFIFIGKWTWSNNLHICWQKLRFDVWGDWPGFAVTVSPLLALLMLSAFLQWKDGGVGVGGDNRAHDSYRSVSALEQTLRKWGLRMLGRRENNRCVWTLGCQLAWSGQVFLLNCGKGCFPKCLACLPGFRKTDTTHIPTYISVQKQLLEVICSNL
jgi:hypothetical protein